MSGSTIGGAVGAVVGFWVGGPAGARWGWMIGSAIGGYVDPEQINAPGIGDAQKQTSSAGVPRPVVYGQPAPFMGNIIDGETKARKVYKTSTAGKGGGPEVKEERFLLTSAIRICEGPIGGVIRIWRNGEVVYDSRPQDDYPEYQSPALRLATIIQARAKTQSFASKVRIYLGTEDQLPDPALEAIHGVGSTPYYRGTAYIVIEDDDVTDTRGACAQYQFEVVASATNGTENESEFLPARWSEFKNAHWPLVDAESDYEYSGSQVLAGGSDLTYSAATIQEILDYFYANNGYGYDQSYYLGYSFAQSRAAVTDKGFDVTETQASVIDSENLTLLYNYAEPTGWFDQVAGEPVCPLITLNSPLWYGLKDGAIIHKMTSGTGGALRGFQSCLDGAVLYGLPPIVITVSRKLIIPEDAGLIAMPDAPGYSVDYDGNMVQDKAYTLTTDTFKQLGVDVLETIPGEASGVNRFAYYRIGPVLLDTDPDYDDEAYWTAAYDAAVTAGTIAAGKTYDATGGGSGFPIIVTSAYGVEQSFDTVTGNAVTLRSVVEDIASRCNVPTSKLDVSALEPSIIPGLLVAQQFTGADCLRPTQQMFFYDLPEIDGQIVAVLRGGDPVVTITDDDLLEVNEDDRTTRPQELEFPLRVSVIAQDPAAEYAPVPQTSERFSPTVKPTSEVVIQSPIPFGADETKRRAAIIHKILWAQAQGRDEFSLPEEFSRLVPSDVITKDGKRWLIEQKDGVDGEYRFKVVYDQASAYTSSATGVTSTPTAPNSGLRGPTRFIAMNLPQLREQDSTPGVYVAACGMLEGWPGAELFLSVDGGVTEQHVLTISNAAVIGELTASVTSSGEPMSVRVYGELEAVTAEQITARANAFAVGTLPIEIGQFQTPTLTDSGNITSDYDLTDLTRGEMGTAAAAHNVGEPFLLLDSAIYFLPIDATHAGKTLIFRAVTKGTISDNNATYSLLYEPPTYIRHGGVVTA